jgi:hypothetical protein
MPVVTFKVLETFRLHVGADLSDLQTAIDMMASEPYSLSQPTMDRGVRFVNLVRDGDVQSDDPGSEKAEPQEGLTANEGKRSQSSSWRDSQWHNRQWKDSDWEDKQWQTTDWTTDSHATDWQDTTHWQDAQWQGGNPCHVCGKVRAEHPGKKFCEDPNWQGGNPCHVCGKVRAEHEGKKFCDLYANKRARV